MPTENCPFEPLDPLKKELPHEERQVLSFAQFHVSGMGCAGCESLIRNNLLALHGVVNVEADHKRQAVDVIFNPQFADHQALLQTINEAGGGAPQKYQARLIN
jgi:copper chaperone CopZ